MAFKQLEQAVVSLRGVVSNVASDGALAQLAAEVRGLGAQFERATADSSTEALAKLEARIASLMESGRAVPPELEGSIRALSERLDRMQLSQGDQLALGALEDRIAKLSEKLDASDSRLGHLEAIERGIGRPAGLSRGDAERRPARPARAAGRARSRAGRAAAPGARSARSRAGAGDGASRNRRIPDAAADAHGRADAAAPQHPPPPSVRAAARADAAAQRSDARRRRDKCRAGPSASRSNPICRPTLRSSPAAAPRACKPGSAAARIAASEAALGHARPMARETGGKSAAIAAARNAAKAAYLDTPVKVPKSLGRKPRTWLKWPFKKAAKDLPAEPQFHAPAPAPSLPPLPAPMPAPMPSTMPDAAADRRRRRRTAFARQKDPEGR